MKYEINTNKMNNRIEQENYDSYGTNFEKYDLLQDRNNDETGTNGVWDLAYDITSEALRHILDDDFYGFMGSILFDEIHQNMYNMLQRYKEAIINQLKEKKD